jgi:hypothetical protein
VGRVIAIALFAPVIAGCGAALDSGAAKVFIAPFPRPAAYEGPSCDGYPQDEGTSVTICEQRSYYGLGATGAARIHAVSGAVYAVGTRQDDVDVDAYVYAQGATEYEARNLAAQIVIHTDDNDFYAEGPSPSIGPTCVAEVTGTCVAAAGTGSWRVSFAAFMPRATDLSADSTSGGVQVDDVIGEGVFHTTSRPMTLRGVGGNVRAESTSGDIDIDLDGATWSGAGLAVDNSSGTITLRASSRYSAQFEASSTSGRIHSDFADRDAEGEYSETLGHGGPTLTVHTSSGDISLLQK